MGISFGSDDDVFAGEHLVPGHGSCHLATVALAIPGMKKVVTFPADTLTNVQTGGPRPGLVDKTDVEIAVHDMDRSGDGVEIADQFSGLEVGLAQFIVHGLLPGCLLFGLRPERPDQPAGKQCR